MNRVKNATLNAMRINSDDLELIKKAATKDFRSTNDYIILNMVNKAKEDLGQYQTIIDEM